MAPKQKPHRSAQEVRTPSDLLTAIADEFHVEYWLRDLAANEENSVADVKGHYYGPASELGEDSLSVTWPAHGDLWLNPPFGNIEPWVETCAKQCKREGRIFVLLPAAVGSNWYLRWVWNRAHVVLLTPRVTFVGHSSPYPKDLLLAVYSAVRGGTSAWRWKD